MWADPCLNMGVHRQMVSCKIAQVSSNNNSTNRMLGLLTILVFFFQQITSRSQQKCLLFILVFVQCASKASEWNLAMNTK